MKVRSRGNERGRFGDRPSRSIGRTASRTD
jgi:hypothetical protein